MGKDVFGEQAEEEEEEENELHLLEAAVVEVEKNYQIVVEQDLVVIMDVDKMIPTHNMYLHLQRIWIKVYII